MLSLPEQLKMKMKLEKTFRPDIRSVFNSMLQDFRVSVARSGLPVDAMAYEGAWTAILDKQYRRVQRAFTGGVGISKSYKQEDDEDEIDEELLAAALMAYREQNIPNQTAFITNTNMNDMRDAIRMAQEEARLEDVTLTNAELALAAAAILRRKFNSRVNRIATQETETVAEATKFIEAEVASDLTPTILGGSVAAVTETLKKWHNMGDSKVRRPPQSQFDHWSVGGQTVGLLEPFIVSGERLMYPKDTSLGASFGNVVECRCMDEYVL